jgi:hypothetical protein
MDASTSEEPPPDSTDFAGWKRAAEQGLLQHLPLEAIAAALQDIQFNTDFGLRNALAKALSDRTYKLLRRQVGRNHPNGGADIIDRVRVQVFEALAQPGSADAKGYRQAFVARLMFRVKDAIVAEARSRRIADLPDRALERLNWAESDRLPNGGNGRNSGRRWPPGEGLLSAASGLVGMFCGFRSAS